MSEFDDLQKALPGLTRLSPEQLDRLRAKYPELPSDYFEFLRSVGFGDLGAIHLYSAPGPTSLIYRNIVNLDHVILIGDDGLGYGFGYDTKDNFRLVEVDPEGDILSLDKRSLVEMVKTSLG